MAGGLQVITVFSIDKLRSQVLPVRFYVIFVEAHALGFGMDAIEIYRTSNCLISLNPDIPAIELTGTGYINSPQLRESCGLTAPLLIENRISKLLVDVKDMFMIGLSDQIWAATSWVPGLIKAGLTSVAIINSKYYFQRIAIEAIVSRLDQSKLTISYFDHKNEAVAWLKSLGQ